MKKILISIFVLIFTINTSNITIFAFWWKVWDNDVITVDWNSQDVQW